MHTTKGLNKKTRNALRSAHILAEKEGVPVEHILAKWISQHEYRYGQLMELTAPIVGLYRKEWDESHAFDDYSVSGLKRYHLRLLKNFIRVSKKLSAWSKMQGYDYEPEEGDTEGLFSYFLTYTLLVRDWGNVKVRQECPLSKEFRVPDDDTAIKVGNIEIDMMFSQQGIDLLKETLPFKSPVIESLLDAQLYQGGDIVAIWKDTGLVHVEDIEE